jgi:ABC-type uncharacterized transport system fused permease/ATPase subunit
MNQCNSVANKILNKINPKLSQQDNSGSILIILSITGIILSLIRIIQECHKKKLTAFLNRKDAAIFMQQEVRTICLKRTLLNKWRLNKIIKQQLSPADFKIIGKQLQQAILDTGEEITEDESLSLLEALNNV